VNSRTGRSGRNQQGMSVRWSCLTLFLQGDGVPSFSAKHQRTNFIDRRLKAVIGTRQTGIGIMTSPSALTISPSVRLHSAKTMKALVLKTLELLPYSSRSALAFALAAWMSGSAGVQAADEVVWHIKAIHPEGRLLDVKAIDKAGKIHAIKAFQEVGNNHVLDVKALVGEKKTAVKVLPTKPGDKYAPVKAIAEDGTLLDIKALTPEGVKLDVKGVSSAGGVTAIKAITPDGTNYGIKAISPEGRVFDVKGIKMNKDAVEGTVNGVDFAAHVKAVPQSH